MQAESFFLDGFFRFLNARGVRYTVMNNYDGYPDVIPSDVDIAISAETFPNLDGLVCAFSAEYELPVVQVIRHGYGKCAYILSPTRLDARFRLQLDFFCDFTAKGYYSLIPAEAMLAEARPMKNFFVPLPAMEAAFLVMRRIIKNDVCAAKLSEIQRLCSQGGSIFWDRVEQLHGASVAKLVREFAESGSHEPLVARNAEHRRLLRLHSLQRSPFPYRWRYRLSELVRLAGRVRHPVGVSVALLGTDGSGKSTLIEHLPQFVGGAFHGLTRRYWSPSVLPRMGRLRFWTPAAEMLTNPQPHGKPPVGWLRSLAKVLYYFVDFAVGYFSLVLPRVIKKDLFLFDRYFYDFWIDPKRHRLNLPAWFTLALCRVLPSPDLVVILDTDPATAHARKQELPLAELERQRKDLHRFAALHRKAVIVDANLPQEEVLKHVAREILCLCATRAKAQLGCGTW